MSKPWPFDQPPNCAVVTSTHVMRHGKPITHVYHDEDDHGWQFHSAEGTRMEHALLVALKEVVKVDESVLEVADLLPGWMARRSAKGGPWTRVLDHADATPVVVKWSTIQTEGDFFDSVLTQCGSPSWHGRNLNALADSWITGGIDQLGPPYAFRFLDGSQTNAGLVAFRDAVQKIGRESVAENGGRYSETESGEDESITPPLNP